MNISWFNKGSVDGIASIYNTNITINKTGSIPFEHAYAAQIGISTDDMCLAIKPLSKDRVDQGTRYWRGSILGEGISASPSMNRSRRFR